MCSTPAVGGFLGDGLSELRPAVDFLIELAVMIVTGEIRGKQQQQAERCFGVSAVAPPPLVFLLKE